VSQDRRLTDSRSAMLISSSEKQQRVLVVRVAPAQPDGVFEPVGQQRPVRQTGEGVAAGLGLQHLHERPGLEGSGDAGPDLVGVKRLGHVVHRSHIEGPHLVVGVVLSGEDDGDVPGQRIVAKPVADAEAAHVGEADVQQDQVRSLSAGLRQPLLAGLGDDEVHVELVQARPHEVSELLRALNDEDALATAHPAVFPGWGVP